MSKLLERECEMSLDARAAMETAEQALLTVKKAMGEEIERLKLELKRCEDKNRKLEQQLTSALGGLGKALTRPSNGHLPDATLKTDDSEGLEEGDNIFDLQVSEATLEVGIGVFLFPCIKGRDGCLSYTERCWARD